MLQIPLRLKLISRSRRGRSAAPQCLDDGLQPGSDFVRQLGKFDVPHQITGISNGDSCRPVEVLQDDVARQRQAGRGVDENRPVRESWITCTKNLEGGPIDSELLLERGRNVDLGQDTEALLLQGSPNLCLC